MLINLNIYTFSTLAASAINLFLSLVVISNNPRAKRNRIYSLFSLFVSIWAFACFLQTAFSSYKVAFFADYLLYSFAIFTPVMFVDFINTYTENINNRIIFSLYLISGILFTMNFTPYFRLGITNELGFRYITIPNTGWYLFNLFYIFCATLGLFKLYGSIIKSHGASRLQLVYLFCAFIVLVIGGSFYLLFSFNIKTPPIDNLFNVISGVLITTIITKTELMDIRVVIGRGLAYGIVGIFMISSFAGLFLLSLPKLLLFFLSAAFALFWAFAAHRAREFIQTPLEEKWITGWYNSDKLINSIARKLVPVMESKEAIKVVAEELRSAIKIKNIEIITDKQNIAVSDVTQTKAGLVIPLASSEGIEGALVLGQKVSEDPYSKQDLTIFRTIMIQAQAIFDRIRPYEKIKRDFEANQQKLFEAEKQLERAQRLSSLGRIVSEVAHEIRNPMAVIFSKAGRIKNNLNDPKYVLEAADLILDRCDHIEKVVGTMRALSLPPKYEPRELDVLEPIENSLRFMPFKSAIKIIKEYSPVPRVLGDKNELERVFINLFTNAYDAMTEKGGELRIRLRPEGRLVRIEVEDTGAGISAEDLPKIFDPFFTTKFGKTDDRMGFGLSIVHNIIVEKHKGTITAASTPGQGTRFSLTLPAKTD